MPTTTCSPGLRQALGRTAVLLGLALALLPVARPAHARNRNCLFQVNGGVLNLSFGTLDPGAATTVVASMTVGSTNANQVGDCRPTAQNITVTLGNGLHFSGGSRRLSNGTDFIPYTLTSPPTAPWTGATGGPWSRSRPGNNTYVPLPAITGTILGANYENVTAGAYSDTIVITVTP